MRVIYLCFVASALTALSAITVDAGSAGENLFEYAYASYGDGGLDFPMPEPPILKVYKDGLAIFRKGEKYFTANIDARKLDELMRKLAKTSFLQQSRFVEINQGDIVGLHGGVVYLRYLDGDNQIIVATGVLPKSGEWAKVVKMVQSYLPRNATPFYPEKVRLRVVNSHHECIKDAENTPDNWPLSSALLLSSSENVIEIADAEVIRFLFKNLYDREHLWFVWAYCEDGKHFRLELDYVSDWYHDDHQMSIGWLARDLQKRRGSERK